MTRRSSTRQEHVRQEVLNVLVAQLLQARGLVAVPESIVPSVRDGSRGMPDVLVDFQGLRLAIEGEFAAPQAATKASAAALKRVTDGVAHVGIALIYPASLKAAPPDIDVLRDRLAEAELRFAIVTETEANQLSLPFDEQKAKPIPFETGNVESLASAMRRSYEVSREGRSASAGGRDVGLRDSDLRPLAVAAAGDDGSLYEGPRSLLKNPSV